MSRYLSETKEALNIWATLAIGILSTSVLYAILSVSGVPKNIGLLIAFLVFLGFILLCQYLLQPLQKIIRQYLIKADQLHPAHLSVAEVEIRSADGTVTIKRKRVVDETQETTEKSTDNLDSSHIGVFVETASGERFSAEVSPNTTIWEIAEEFFKSRGWPLVDSFGRASQAVVELIISQAHDMTKRLPLHVTMSDAGVVSGDILRIFPELVAGCFPLGTLIRMADGKQTPIESIKIDDEVMSWDLENRRPISTSIIGIHKEQAASILLLINSQLKISVSQPVWVNNSWKFAKDIKVGDQLMGLNRQLITSHNISSVEEPVDDQQQVAPSHYTGSIERFSDNQPQTVTINDISSIDGLFDVRHLSTVGGMPFFAENILVQSYNATGLPESQNPVYKRTFNSLTG